MNLEIMGDMNNKEIKVTSLQVLEVLKQGEKDVYQNKNAHSHILNKARKMIKELGEKALPNFRESNYTNTRGKILPCIEFSKRGAIMFMSSYDVLYLNTLMDYIEDLENKLIKEKQENLILTEDNKSLTEIAMSDKEQEKRIYETKLINFSIRRIPKLLMECDRTNIDKTIDDIINFHTSIKPKDRYNPHMHKSAVKYKNYIRNFVGKKVQEVMYCNTRDIPMCFICLEKSKELLKDTLSTNNKSFAMQISNINKNGNNKNGNNKTKNKNKRRDN